MKAYFMPTPFILVTAAAQVQWEISQPGLGVTPNQKRLFKKFAFENRPF